MICCAQAYALWGSRCPTFTASPSAGIISEQKGVSRHIPQPEMPMIASTPSSETTDTTNFSTFTQNIGSIATYLHDQRLLTDTAYDEVTKRVNELSESFDISFSKNSLSASMSAVAMVGGPGNRGYVQTKQGTMIILAARVSADVAVGSVTIEIEKNGILTGFQVTLDLPDHATSNTNQVEPGNYNYDAADQLTAVITTSADFSPSPHIDVSLGLVHG